MTEEAAKPLSPGVPGAEMSRDSPDESQKGTAPGRFKRLSLVKKVLLVGLFLTPILVAALWIAVHSLPWMGPLVANTLRATIGKDNVTHLEEFVYSIEDRVNQTVKSGDAPKAYWKIPEVEEKAKSPAPSAPSPTESPGGTPKVLPAFSPPTPGPVHKEWSAEGDGKWVAMVDPRRASEAPRMFKTLLHPDSSRSWAELFVVAVDLRQVAVMPVMGYQEPRTDKKEAQGYKRPAKIPEEHYGALLGAFNGGFMAEHGSYGVYFDGITFLDPKDDACTLAHYKDGSFKVASWSKIKDAVGDMQWYRQAPNCMYEDGVMHPALKVHRARKWGATLDGNTVIRRSAVGLSRDGQILYVGISNHTTAKAMAAGMNHAGAVTVAQMDVNWSYPKFVTFEKRADDLLHPVALAEGFEFSDKLYLRERSMRDFFYLARLEEVPEQTSAQLDPPGSAPSLPTTPGNKDSAKDAGQE